MPRQTATVKGVDFRVDAPFCQYGNLLLPKRFFKFGKLANVGETVTSDDVTTVTAQVGGSGFNGPSHFAFTVGGGRIHLMRITG